MHKTKLQTLLSDKVPKRYGLESFSLVHSHSHMSSLDYFEITSFPNLFPQLSKDDLFDMFLLDHKEILDQRVSVSLNLFCHDQHSNVFLRFSIECGGLGPPQWGCGVPPGGMWGPPRGVSGSPRRVLVTSPHNQRPPRK